MASSGSFDSAYRGTPPWDIGRPQPAIERLADTGQITGLVLDVGCGTGESALHLAQRGYEVVGIDGSPRAIAKASAKAKARRLNARFEIADALRLPMPERPFDTVIDSGLFHVFSDDERLRFRESLAGVIRPGGTYFMLCFSERQPGSWGPRRVTQREIRSTFADGWRIKEIQPSVLEMNEGTALAWVAAIYRLGGP
jgi:SAM-dependent methyltransferase